MIRSSKTKEAVARRRTPSSTDASQPEESVRPATTSESAQKFMAWPEGQREQIATKAYELWQQRGCRDGYDRKDWFDAEALVAQTLEEAPQVTGRRPVGKQ